MFFCKQLEPIGRKHRKLILEIYREKPTVRPFPTGMVVKPEYVGALCPTCQRSAVDRNPEGLRCPICGAEWANPP